MQMFKRLIAVAVMMLLSIGSANGVLVISSDQASFDTSVGLLGLSEAGTEDFESSTLADNSTLLINDVLSPGVANGTFANGTLGSPGITVQSNTNADNGASVNARGGQSLFTHSDGYFGGSSDIVGTALGTDSLDILLPDVSDYATHAISLTPLFVGFINGIPWPTLPATFTIRVFDTSNVELTSHMLTTDNTGDVFIGFIATAGEQIGRINIDNFTYDTDVSLAVDNITTYTTAPTRIPEPSALLTYAVILIGITLIKRSRP